MRRPDDGQDVDDDAPVTSPERTILRWIVVLRGLLLFAMAFLVALALVGYVVFRLVVVYFLGHFGDE